MVIGSGELSKNSKKSIRKNISPNVFVNIDRAANIYDPVQKVSLPRKNLTSFDHKENVESGN